MFTFEYYQERLLPYLRSWKRHRIHFGVHTGRVWMKKASLIFPAACCTLDGEWHYAEEWNLDAISVIVRSEALYYRFPHSWPAPEKRGLLNASFLEPEQLLREHLFPAVQNVGIMPAQVIFPIPIVFRTESLTAREFVNKIDRFLGALPSSYHYGVQVFNPEFLTPEYSDALRTHNVAHILHDTGVTLIDQSQSPYLFPGKSVVVFSEVKRCQVWRVAVRAIVKRCLQEGKALYCYFQDSGKPSLLSDIYDIMEYMDHDLAKLSFIKKQGARRAFLLAHLSRVFPNCDKSCYLNDGYSSNPSG